MDALYMVHDAEKLGLAQFPLVEASITLVQVPNLVLLSKDATCPNKQCRVSEVILKHAYSASAFAARLTSYSLQCKHSTPPFRGVTTTSVTDRQDAAVVFLEVAAMLQKQAIHMIDTLQLEQEFYSSTDVYLDMLFQSPTHQVQKPMQSIRT
ncbi:UNVERIFIED_CONTAM: hypothetical protein FKN15_040401 [Acipenser sinensis]